MHAQSACKQYKHCTLSGGVDDGRQGKNSSKNQASPAYTNKWVDYNLFFFFFLSTATFPSTTVNQPIESLHRRFTCSFRLI